MQKSRNTLVSLLAAAGFAMAAAPSLAQTVEELTVTGRLGPDGEVRTLSRAVSFADLDLTRTADQDVLRTRIKDTAGALCSELGEGGAATTPLTPSCRDDAMRDAMKQARMAFASATPREAYAAPTATDVTADASATVSEPAPPPAPAADAAAYGQEASVTVQTVTNEPVPDTAANRVRYGQPMSHAGKRTDAAGN